MDAGKELRISALGDGGDATVRSLYEWFVRDPDLMRHAQVRLTASAPAVPGEQGGLLDVIEFIATTGFSTAGLLLSYLQWRQARSAPPTPATAVVTSGVTVLVLDHLQSADVDAAADRLDGR